MNVLYETLPYFWNGYRVNMEFQTGVQVMCAMHDKELTEEEKTEAILFLLFYDEDTDSIRDFPDTPEQMQELFSWYFNGWNHDKHKEKEDKTRIIDFYVDQWRIYADFRHIYNINLNEAELHFWEFEAMLWNMPTEQSSLMQVIQARTKKPRKKASREEIEQINENKAIYGLDQPEKVMTDEEKAKIDEYDRMRAAQLKRKQIADEALSLMR